MAAPLAFETSGPPNVKLAGLNWAHLTLDWWPWGTEPEIPDLLGSGAPKCFFGIARILV